VESLKQTFSTCKVIHDTVMFHQSSLALERTLTKILSLKIKVGILRRKKIQLSKLNQRGLDERFGD